MKLSTKTEATPILVSEGTSSNGALQLLANRYAKRLARIHKRMASKNRKLLIQAVLERRAQWKRLYSPEYFNRYFHPYDGELEALLDVAEERFPLDHLPEGSH